MQGAKKAIVREAIAVDKEKPVISRELKRHKYQRSGEYR